MQQKDFFNIAIIPARGGSKGIPKKNIIDFCGEPLIAYSIKQAKKSEKITDVYVTSDSQEILNIAQKYSAKPILRPKDISGDRATSESALSHALNCIKEKPNYVVFLQATSPLRETQDIDEALDKMEDMEYDSLFSATSAEDTFIWEVDQKNNVKSITYDYKNRKRRQELSCQIVENGSFYIFKPSVLEIYNNRLGGKIGFFLMEKWKTHEIDSYDDLELCKLIYQQRLKEK